MVIFVLQFISGRQILANAQPHALPPYGGHIVLQNIFKAFNCWFNENKNKTDTKAMHLLTV